MAFDKKLLPEGAITLQEFMEKRNPKEIEGFRVSYLLPDGKPLKYKGSRLEGVEVEIEEGPQDVLSLHIKGDKDSSLSRNMCGWEPTYNWGNRVSLATANESAIAVLDYFELGQVGKSADDWVEIEGFDPMWLEGARFEGREGRFVFNAEIDAPHLSIGWESSRAPRGRALRREEIWREDVFAPWRTGELLYLTLENEAKALALLEVVDKGCCWRREERLPATCESRDSPATITHEDNSCASVLEALKGLIEEWRSTRNCCPKGR